MSTIENLEAMLAQGRDSALLRYGLGAEYLKAEQPDHAIDQLREALRLDPGYSAAWKLLGKALASVGRHADAIDAFDRGIAVADGKGDIQAANEMRVFRSRAIKAMHP